MRVGSQVFQAWRKFMDEIEQQSKQLRTNAEQLETLCSDRMAQLYQDKRKSRKQYQEEHAKIASQFAHVSRVCWVHRFPRHAQCTDEFHEGIPPRGIPEVRKARDENFNFQE
jgi:hypothetical protein